MGRTALALVALTLSGCGGFDPAVQCSDSGSIDALKSLIVGDEPWSIERENGQTIDYTPYLAKVRDSLQFGGFIVENANIDAGRADCSADVTAATLSPKLQYVLLYAGGPNYRETPAKVKINYSVLRNSSTGDEVVRLDRGGSWRENARAAAMMMAPDTRADAAEPPPAAPPVAADAAPVLSPADDRFPKADDSVMPYIPEQGDDGIEPAPQ